MPGKNPSSWCRRPGFVGCVSRKSYLNKHLALGPGHKIKDWENSKNDPVNVLISDFDPERFGICVNDLRCVAPHAALVFAKPMSTQILSHCTE
jgi:hypothetical protein